MSEEKTICGKLIAVEGIDGAGKSSVAWQLGEHMREKTGRDSFVMAFPRRNTAIGTLIGQHLRGDHKFEPLVVHQLFSANRLEQMPRIKQALESGRNVILDRYFFSGAAYTMAQDDRATAEWCLVHDLHTLAPDEVFWLRIKPEQAVERLKARGDTEERYENVDFLRKVARKFQKVFGDEGFHPSPEIESFLRDTEVHEIDASLPPNKVFADIVAVVDALETPKAGK